MAVGQESESLLFEAGIGRDAILEAPRGKISLFYPVLSQSFFVTAATKEMTKYEVRTRHLSYLLLSE